MKTLSSSNSRIREDNSTEEIPLDLIIEILLKLPAKSIARFCFVSKLWGSTVHSPNFTDSFSTISSSRPKLLFSVFKDGETFFFSSVSPQHKVSSRNPSPIVAKFHMKVPFGNGPSIRGMVCGLNQWTSTNGTTVTLPLICNPSTGQSWTLPIVKTERKDVRSYLGYDPIDKGKLAMLQLNMADQTGIQLWVLEDSEKHQWLKHIYVLPRPWKDIAKDQLSLVGMTRTGEIVLSPNDITVYFYLLYYNTETDTITRVEIQGMEAFKNHFVYTFLDHVEDIKHMENV